MKAVQRIRKIASIIMLIGFIGSNLLDSFSYVFAEEIFLEAENEIEIMDKKNDLEEGELFDSEDKTEHSEGNNTDIEEQPEYLEIAGDEEPETNTGNNEQEPETNTGNNEQEPEINTGNTEPEPGTNTGNTEPEPETNTGNNEQEPETNTGNSEQQPETNTGDNEQQPETNTGNSEQQPETNTGDNEQQPETNTGNNEQTLETNTGDNEQQPETNTGDNEHEPQTNTDLWEEGEDFYDMVYTGVVRGKEYRITLMDRNLGALTMDSQEEDSYGYYYQWGNNYPFSHHTNLNQYTTQRVDASGYGPDNRFIGEKYIKGHTDWSNVQNDNLWGGEGDNVDNDFNNESNRQGPCPEGYYVPSVGDWHALLSTFLVNNEIDETTTDGWVYPDYIGNERHAGYYIESEDIENFKETFNITYAGRIKNDGTVDRTGTTAHLWTSTPYNGTTLGFEVWDNRINLGGWETTRATAYPIRCFKSVESEYVDYIIKYKDGENETIQTGHRGDILTEPEHEDRGTGYEWMGWYKEGEDKVYDFSTPITGNITLVATWKCAENYHEKRDEEDALLCKPNTKTVDCTQTGGVANSTYVVTGVELTWDITGHKWDEIPACEWKCLTDYHLTGGQCESNTKIVDCIQTGKVENSTYIVSGVVITWDITGDNRSETPVCQRICNQHYHLSEGICSIDMFEFTLVENSHVNTSGSTESGQKPYDSKIELEAHSNTGYRFMGWQIIGLQGSGTSITTIDSQVVFNMPDRNVTATPLTDLIEYNIIYNNVEDAVMDNPNTYNIETETFTLNEPTKTGYTFLGWTGSNGLNPEKEVTLTEGNYGNKKYSAVWQPNSGIIYQVVHAVEKADSTSYELMETEILSGTTDEMTQAVAKEYTGFTAKEIIQKIIKGDGSTIVRVQYQRNIYTITFDSNGGSDVSPITGKYGSNLTTPSNPTKGGYIFNGWQPSFPATMPLEGAELVAQWKKRSGGGSSSSSEEVGVETGNTMTGVNIITGTVEEMIEEVENLNVDAGTSVAPMLGNTMKLGAAMLNAVPPVETNEELEEARKTLNKNKIKGKETYNNVTINVEAPIDSFPDGTVLRIVPITGAEQKQSIKEQLMENENVTTESELVSFDVSFVYVTSDGEEIEVQPAEGQKVKVTFNYKNNNKFNKAKKEKDGELKVYHFEKVKNRKGKDTGKVEIKEIEINETESIEGELVVDAEKFSVYTVAAVKGATRGGSAYTIMDQMPTFTWTEVKVQGNDGNCLFVMDRDLGASSASTSSIGYYYQWGNNYGFTASWAEDHNQGSNQIDIEGLTYYTGDIFVKRNPWHTPNTIYLWGGQGDESSNNWGYGLNDFGERQGPCPQDWHVPSRGEWEKLKAYDSGLSRSSSKYKRTSGGDIKSNNAKIENSSYYYYWTSSPSSTTSSNSFYYAQLASSMSANISRYASYGVKVRCFKNTYNCDGQVIEGGSCDLPWGGTVEDGESVTGYTTSSATCPNACVSATATCNNGEWSVDNFETTYTNQTCTTNPSTCDTSFTLNSTGTNGIYSGCTTYTVNANSCNPGTTKYKLTNCENGYHTENNSTCVSNSKQVACVQNGKPTNSSYITGNVTINWQGTWNSGNWSTTGNCAWKCDAHYHTGANGTSCEIDQFLITWLDGNGQILTTGMVNYNVVPTYSGPTPTKIATAQYTYTFNDTWSPTPVAATTGATYTAEFNRTINRYDVTFNPNGGNVSPTTMTVMLDSTYGDLPTPIKTGYIFDGWALNDNFGKMVSWEQGGIGDANGSNANNMNNRIRTLYTNINSGTTYYFKLVSSNSYVVRYIHEYTSDKTWVKGTSFNKTSGSFTTSPTTSLIRVVVQYSNASTQISPSDSDNFTLQLNTVNSFETPVYPYLPTTPVTIANDHTLVAIWNPSTYYIAYNNNGGVGNMSNTTCTYDSGCALRTNTFTRSGYIFKGWSTSPSAISATYTNGQDVTNLTGSNGNTVTLYAVWKDNTKPVCTWGAPSKIILKSGETGSVVLTCTDTVGIVTSSLTSGDILLSNNYVTLSNATVGGTLTGRMYTFTYTAKANTNGSVIFTLPGNKVKDAAGNSALINTNISAVRVDNLQPSCEIKTQPMKPLLKGGQTGSVAFMCISTGTEVSTASLASSSVNYNSNYFTLSNATVTTTEELPDDPSAHLTVVVSTITTPANGESYGLGEEIFYRVEVENDYGNLIIRDITLEDDEGNTWYICSLVPGGVETFLASHVVTKDDIENGEYVKVVTAEGTSQDPDEPDVPVDPGVDPEPTLEVEDFGDDWDLIEDVEQPSSQHINLNAACNNKKIYTFTYTAKSNVDGTGTFTLKSNQVSDVVGNKNAATNQSNVVVVDNTPPTLRYTVTDTPKSTTQTGRMKCTDAGGVTAWYLGNNSPSLSDITSTNDLSILTSDGLTAARVPAGTYYIGCRDTAGNFSTGSATLVSYQVKNMLDKISGTQGTYTTNNYDINSTTPTSSTYYVIPSGTSLTLSNLCTAPTTASTLKITSIGNPGTTAATSATTANAANQTYACWYNRNMYTITYNLNGGTETLTNPTTYTVEDGTFGLYQPTKTGYMFLGWTGSNGTIPNANIYISQGSTGNRTYNAVWGDFENIDAYFISDTGAVSYITLMDRNMGASSDNITSTGSFGFKYQWGNNHGFADECWTEGCSDSVTASATTTKAIWDSSYDNKGYNGTVFVKATSQPYDYWSDSILGNDNHFNLRGGGSDEVSNNWGMDTMTTENIINRQGPCPAGYHVPSIGEWNNLLKYRVAEYTGNGNTLSLNAGGSSKLNYFSDSVAREKFQQDFDIVFAGHRYRTMANIENQGVEAYLWSSSTSKFSNSEGARFLKITMTDVLNNYNIHRALGHSVRCFSNNYMFSQPSMNVVPNGGTGAMILVEGGTIKSLGIPHRDIHSTFQGWYSNSAMTTSVSTGDIAPTNLYAKWICDTGYTDNGTECVDNTPPTLFADKSSNSRYISDITITLSASDENGLNYAKYSRTSESDCVSNGTSFSSGTTITDNAEGTRTLYLCAEDNAGNIATWTGIYKLDKTNPVCGTWTYEPPLSIWTNGSVVATLAGSTDATAGIQTGGGSCNISTYNGTCSVTISDNAGNTNVCTSSGITNIDETKPTCTVSVSPSQIKWPQQGTVTFTCTDMGAGIKTTSLTSGAVVSTNVASMTNAVVTNVTNGKSYTFTYTPATAGTSTFKLAAGSVSDNANNTNDITSQGSVTVQRRDVIITSASDSKSYDAMALTNDSYTISGDGFATGNGVNCNVTGSQTLVGSSDNIFECTFNQGTNSGNYNISKVYGTLTITDTDVDPDLVVVKIASDVIYRLGDTVTFTIIVTNIYDEPYTITLSEIEGVTLAQSTFENVAAGASITTTATYTITQADILAGGFTNTVTAHLGNITKTATAIVETEYPNGHLTVQKETTSETPEGGYKLGDTVTYRITVTNNGNLTITDIVVEDERTGDEWPIQSLAPGDSEVFETYTEVVEEDIFAGHIINDVTARGTSPDPDNPNVPVDPGHTDDDPEEVNPSLDVEKVTTTTSANGESYVLGETIEYEITVTNDGNLTINNIVVEDELTNNIWTGFSLAPGASTGFTTSYVVTESDVIAGSVKNSATANGDNDSDEPTDPGKGETEDPTEDPDPSLHVEKTTTSTPANGETYALGEEITYRIVVTNDGNLTVRNIRVEDELAGDEWYGGSCLDNLSPGRTCTFTTYYYVTEEDILAGSVKNEATADGDNDSDEPTDPGDDEVEDPTDDPHPSLDVEKVTTTTPANGESYVLGETIEYEITITNDGNLTIDNIVVEDELTNNIWTGFSLAPGASTGFTTSYVVTESDVIAGSVKNEATADGENESDEPTDPGVGDTEDPTKDDIPPVCTWGAPSKILLKSGQTGSIVLTCTDEIGIDTNVLTGGDITLSNNYVTLSNATVGGSAKSRTFTFTYTAKSNVNGAVTFTLPANKVSDLLGNFATSVTSSGVSIDNTKPTCTISQSPSSGVWTSGDVILRVSVIEDNPDKYSWTGWNNMVTTTGTYVVTNNGNKVFYLQDKVGNTGSCSITVSNIDKVSPSPSSSATYSPKKFTQGWTGSCTDNVGITAYYMGTKSNPSDSDYVTIPSTSSFTTGMVVTQTGTYYRYCKDAAGNVSSTTSKTYNAYTVHNMLNAVDKPEGIYNETNYPQATVYTYLASSGTTISLNNYIYTAPTYASSSTYRGATTSPSGTPAVGMSQKLTSDADFYFWFDRTKYNLNLTVNTGIDAIYYKVNGANSFDSTGINAIVQMKAGSDASVYAEASNCYTYTATSEGNPQSWTNITAAKTFSPTATENTNTITYNMNGGTNNANNPSSYKITQLPIALQGPTRTGYTFKGWTGSNGSTAQTSVSIAGGTCGALTYNAIWQANTYNISYTMNGGTQGANHPVSATYDTPFTVDNPTKVGYTFSGWKITGMDEGVTHYYGNQTTTSTTISSTKATGFNNLTSVSGNTVNFEALWTINQYTAIILAEPSGYGTVSPTSVKKDYNSNITISGNTITIGGTTMTASPKARTAQYTYTFSGWVNNCGDKLTGDCTITAQFDRSINQYTVTVTATPAEWAESITGAGVYNYGDSVTVKLVPLKGYTVTAYMINGERTEVTTHANTYSISQPSLKGNLNIVYELDPTQYRVTFNKNGGTGTMSPQILLYDDEPVALSKNLFTRTGYSFTGWALTTTGGVTFEDEEKVKNILDLSKTRYSINLFAVWELDNYTITYNLNGGTNNANNPSTYTIESGDITLQSPTRVGYTFLGWTGENVDTPQTGVIIPAGSYGNKTYNATWQADTNIHYEIYHYVKKVGENIYVLSDTETKNDGITDATVILSSLAKENEFLCAHYDRGSLTGTENGPGEIVTQTTINGDGSTKIYLYYNRIYYNITLSGDEHVESLEGDGVRECGSERPIDATPKPGYHFVRWDREERERREDDKKS